MTSNYRMAPAFSACLRWSAWFCVALVVVVLVVVGGGRLLQGQPLPEHWASRPQEFLVFVLALTMGMALLVYGVGWFFAAKLSGTSLIATSVWGRGIEVPLSSVTEIQPMSVEGIPTLLVKSSATKSSLYILALGLDTREVYEHLRVAAGAGHPLTRWFAPREV